MTVNVDSKPNSKVEELSREERLGPGGLDPVEVFGTLPEAMQEAFQSKEVGALQGDYGV